MTDAWHRIANLVIHHRWDIRIAYLESEAFQRFAIPSGSRADILFDVHELSPGSFTAPPLTPDERARLLQCPSIHEAMFDDWAWRSTVVRQALEPCLDHPQAVRFEGNWNGIFIRDYQEHHMTVLYPAHKSHIMTSELIIARIRNWLATFMPSFDAIMLHLAGVVRPAGAALFAAHDEGGKTTVVNSGQHRAILNDDHVILRQHDSTIVAHSTPIGIDPITSGPTSATIGAFFLLEKAPSFALSPAKPADLIQHLWNEHPHHWQHLPKALRIRAFDLLYEACHAVPVYHMQFTRNDVDWAAIDAAMV